MKVEEGVKLVRLGKQGIEAAGLGIGQLEDGPDGPAEVGSSLESDA